MSRRVAVVTGSRADFGLLRSTMEAISAAPELDLQVVVAGAHLLPPDETIDEVRDCFEVDAVVEMQHAGRMGRTADATATGRGVVGFTAAFDRLDPDVVLVLGDRIEAFAAAASAGIGGRLVAHVHGGDRAEGVADESMRHAITKLAHLHFPATPTSGERIRRLGEPTVSVHVVGSPAADGIDVIPPLDDAMFDRLGRPRVAILHHGSGLAAATERAWIEAAIDASLRHGPVVVLRPNHDPGSDVVEQAGLEGAARPGVVRAGHLPRQAFIGLLRRTAVLVGNSSAGLIEAPVVGCPTVNLGPRQAGRERPGSVVDVDRPDVEAIADAIGIAVGRDGPFDHPYGEGGTGRRIAGVLAGLVQSGIPRKRNSF
jgi:UDP-N-acetylglucosamine 2-epimerase (non-hydrolysing)